MQGSIVRLNNAAFKHVRFLACVHHHRLRTCVGREAIAQALKTNLLIDANSLFDAETGFEDKRDAMPGHVVD